MGVIVDVAEMVSDCGVLIYKLYGLLSNVDTGMCHVGLCSLCCQTNIILLGASDRGVGLDLGHNSIPVRPTRVSFGA